MSAGMGDESQSVPPGASLETRFGRHFPIFTLRSTMLEGAPPHDVAKWLKLFPAPPTERWLGRLLRFTRAFQCLLSTFFSL
jgi:hypothetical protein